MKFVFLILIFVLSNLITSAQMTGKLIDVRDGHVYKTIQIGNQIWMAENLNFTTDSGSICYDNQPSNCEKFGRLYTWDVAKIVCPKGWHLPSDNEWQILERTLGMPENNLHLLLLIEKPIQTRSFAESRGKGKRKRFSPRFSA